MEHIQFLRIKKLKYGGIIQLAASHNLREIQVELGADSHIDPLKTSTNKILRGADNAEEVARQAKILMLEAGIKPLRKDAVLGLELVVSLRPSSGLDESAFFDSSLSWADGFFELPIISAVVHNDEAAPHMHIIMLPLFDKRMIGNRIVGNKTRLNDMQADFFAKVGQRYGLTRGTQPRRLSSAARARAAALVIDFLGKNPKSINEPTFRDALRELVTVNPLPMILALGLKMPEDLKPKIAKAIVFAEDLKPKAIVFAEDSELKTIAFNPAEKPEDYLCVVFGDYPPVPKPSCPSNFTRESENNPAMFWNEDAGEFIKASPKARVKSFEVERVRQAIQDLRHD